MLSKLIDEAKDNDYRILVAGIDSSNKGSIKLHDKFGFIHSGTIKHAGYKFDQWLDTVYLEKHI